MLALNVPFAEKGLARMLKNKTENGCNAKSGKDNYSPSNPSGFNFWFVDEFVPVPKNLPVTSNQIGSYSRVTRGQITRSHQTFSNKATFWKMSGVSSTRHESSVSGWSGSSESSNHSEVSFQGEGVFRVNTVYGRPIELKDSKHVVNYHNVRTDPYAWIPKQQPSAIAKPQVNPGFSEDQTPVASSQRNYSQCGKGDGGNRHYATRTRTQSVTIHKGILTQLAYPEGECC